MARSWTQKREKRPSSELLYCRGGKPVLGTVGGPQSYIFLEAHECVIQPLTVQCTKNGLLVKQKAPKKTVLFLVILLTLYYTLNHAYCKLYIVPHFMVNYTLHSKC